MNIVFFSTNSNVYNSASMNLVSFPSNCERLEELARMHPEHKFTVATQLPGMFLLDCATDGSFPKAEGVLYHLIESEKADDIAEEILTLSPDIAIAASFWIAPYDWLSVHDSQISDFLRKKNIPVLCHSTDCALICFDKQRTHSFLEPLGFKMPKSVYVHHDLFLKVRKDVKLNVYYETVLNQIKNLKFPAVIKDTLGLSSYGMDVVNFFGEAKSLLLSKKNKSDRLVEEFIDGIQFGAEIYGRGGSYTVLPPLMYSVNKYGITSPKQSIKLGPITNPRFHIDELTEELKKLACVLNLSGNAQVDLVFKDGEWYVIEVNPRLSGSSELYAAYEERSVFERLLGCALDLKNECASKNECGLKIKCAEEVSCAESFNTVEKEIFMNYKVNLLDNEKIREIQKLQFVIYVRQVQNLVAKQERETGYCEIVFKSGPGSYEEKLSSIKKRLEELSNRFPEIIEDILYERAVKLIETARLKC